MEDTRVCAHCGVEQQITKFCLNLNTVTGKPMKTGSRSKICNKCRSAKYRSRRRQNRTIADRPKSTVTQAELAEWYSNGCKL